MPKEFYEVSRHGYKAKIEKSRKERLAEFADKLRMKFPDFKVEAANTEDSVYLFANEMPSANGLKGRIVNALSTSGVEIFPDENFKHARIEFFYFDNPKKKEFVITRLKEVF